MKLLTLLLILVSTPIAATEIYYGYGTPYKADKSGSSIQSFSIERNKWKVDYQYWQDYTLSPGTRDTQRQYGFKPIEHHHTLSVSRNIYKYNFKNNCNFYFDFGLAYTTKISRATSSPFLFQESIGYQCGWWRLEVNHQSNAGLRGENTGADGIFLKILLWGDGR